MAFEEKRFRTRDRLNLYYRDHANSKSTKAPVLCLSDTTANSRVYEELAPHLQRKRRVLCLDGCGLEQAACLGEVVARRAHRRDCLLICPARAR